MPVIRRVGLFVKQEQGKDAVTDLFAMWECAIGVDGILDSGSRGFQEPPREITVRCTRITNFVRSGRK